jgi:hypothetical protein
MFPRLRARNQSPSPADIDLFPTKSTIYLSNAARPQALILRLRSNLVTRHRDDQKPAINYFFLVVYVRILNAACSSGACSSDDVNVASRAMDLPPTIHDETVRLV